MDIEAENKALDLVEEKYIVDNDKVKELIVSTNTSYKEISIGTVTLRIKSYMPKKTRKDALRVGRELEGANEDTISAIEEKLYPIIASMCVDGPFTDALTWKHIDEQTGCVQAVLFEMINEVMKTDEKVKSFRRKQ